MMRRTRMDFLQEMIAKQVEKYGPDMQERVASLIEKLNWEHKVDIIRCARSGSTPVRIRMWQDLVSMGVVEIRPGKALDGWVLTDFGKAVADEVLATKEANSYSPHKTH